MKRFTRFIAAAVAIPLLVSGLCIADNDGTASADNTYVVSGKTVVNTGWDNGFKNSDPISSSDDHYGWSLGDFVISGFTSQTEDGSGNPVFLKNVGDKVKLSFNLQQDIDHLNKKNRDDIYIYPDKDAYDVYFQTKEYSNCRGLLITRKTNYDNSVEDPVVYSNFLSGVKVGADTEIDLFEEGDYEVSLDYEICETYFGYDTLYYNYKIFFKFSVRNGNCMVFPRDINGNELTDSSYAEDGFFLDLANSRYLDINIKRSVLSEGSTGLTEDTRFNRPATDGEKYTEDGIYTITATNRYTGETTVKEIMVGTDPVIKTHALTGMSIDEINEALENGAIINEEGVLVTPAPADEQEPADNNKTEKKAKNESAGKKEKSHLWIYIAAAVIAVIAIVSIVDSIVIRKKKKGTPVSVDDSGSDVDEILRNASSERSSNDEERENNDEV